MTRYAIGQLRVTGSLDLIGGGTPRHVQTCLLYLTFQGAPRPVAKGAVEFWTERPSGFPRSISSFQLFKATVFWKYTTWCLS